jgi:enamine deaminase RidA (YjgF/YER057c/UK114 family)
MLFGVIQLDEARMQAPGKTPLRQAAEFAYSEIFGLAARLNFPIILRFWNYMADINGESHGLERYRQFNMGRQDGFAASGHRVEGGSVPAASAVGFADGPFTVCFLASRKAAAAAIENPRQISAYRYPAQYGPRSPTFSRASLVRLGDADALFISGTASIVGHETLHAGDAAAQSRETVANLAAIVEQANLAARGDRFSLSELCCKVYVRRDEDMQAIHDELRRGLGASARLLFLKADICRRDLLVEVEATAGLPVDFAVPC